MRKCLKGERLQRQKANNDEAVKKHATIRARILAQQQQQQQQQQQH